MCIEKDTLEIRRGPYSKRLRIRLPHGNFIGIIRSHGWSQLEPYFWDEEAQILKRIEHFGQQTVQLIMKQGTEKEIMCFASSKKPIRANLMKNLSLRLEYMFNCDADYTQFLKKARSLDPEICQMAKKELNPFLRGSSLFEDVIKTLFTTNASWAYTKKMCQSLLGVCTKHFGWVDAEKTFPSVSQVLSIPMSVLEGEGRMGYRSKYLRNIAKKFNYCDEFVGWSKDAILQELSTVKGLGSYSINHVAMLLGKNDRIPIDSEVRRIMRLLGRSDKKTCIEEYYALWDPYQNLAFRLECKLHQGKDFDSK